MRKLLLISYQDGRGKFKTKAVIILFVCLLARTPSGEGKRVFVQGFSSHKRKAAMITGTKGASTDWKDLDVHTAPG